MKVFLCAIFAVLSSFATAQTTVLESFLDESPELASRLTTAAQLAQYLIAKLENGSDSSQGTQPAPVKQNPEFLKRLREIQTFLVLAVQQLTLLKNAFDREMGGSLAANRMSEIRTNLESTNNQIQNFHNSASIERSSDTLKVLASLLRMARFEISRVSGGLLLSLRDAAGPMSTLPHSTRALVSRVHQSYSQLLTIFDEGRRDLVIASAHGKQAQNSLPARQRTLNDLSVRIGLAFTAEDLGHWLGLTNPTGCWSILEEARTAGWTVLSKAILAKGFCISLNPRRLFRAEVASCEYARTPVQPTRKCRTNCPQVVLCTLQARAVL